MMDNDLREMIDEALADHVLEGEVPSKSWKVKTPGKHSYWFYVTWTPGHLLLSGDLCNMVLTHWHAMPTAEEAVRWMHDAHEGYLLGKSDAVQKFDAQATKASILDMADQDVESEDYDIWEKIFEFVDMETCEDGEMFIYPEEAVEKKESRDKARHIFEDKDYCLEDWTPEGVYDYFQIDDYSGTYNYTEQHEWQISALKKWASLAIKELDEQAA